MTKIIFYILLLTSSLYSTVTGPAELTPTDVVFKSREMLLHHATYKQVTSELAARVLQSFCEEMDPLKTYFFKSEVIEYIEPSEETLNQVILSFRTGRFTIFEEIFRRMRNAIVRRKTLEQKLSQAPLLKGATIKVYELDWVANEEELLQRLVLMQSVQLEAAENLDSALYSTTLQRINKRRLTFEQQRSPQDPSLMKKILSTFLMKSFAAALDSETAYFTPAEARQLLISMQQRLFGIGVVLRDDIDGFSVLKLVEGGPAARQGELAIGDKVIAVDEEPVIGFELHEVVELIRGEPGTYVTLKTVRKTEVNGQQKTSSFDIRIRRGEVVVQDLRYGSEVESFDGGVVAYLRLHSFYQDQDTSSYDDLLASLEKLQRENNVKGVILDLRCNPGGLLSQAVAVAGLFLHKGIVVSIKDESGEVVHLRNLTTKRAWDGPLVILISRASASASEIVAQTLQDWGRAIVVGDDRSFGKGSFQLFTLCPDGVTPPNPQGEYKVTRGRYYTVSGKSPQLVGVQSDVYVPGLLCFAEVGEQFNRFPLTEDMIDPNFEDSLSDISFFQRRLLSQLYEMDRQVKGDTWTRFIPQLQKNSAGRINQNEGYQRLLDRAHKLNFESSPEEGTDKDVDYQLNEAKNIIKDLIKLSSDKKEQLASKKAA